jgi:hypothetical protein
MKTIGYHSMGRYITTRTISEEVIYLLTRTEMVLETFVYSPFNYPTRLLAQEYFIVPYSLFGYEVGISRANDNTAIITCFYKKHINT